MESARLMHNKTVCVTGTSSGMGRAISGHLGSLGAHVFMMGRTAEPMEHSADVICAAGEQADVAVFDLSNLDALATWVTEAANATLLRLYVMVNNAGRGEAHGALFTDGDPAVWREMFEVNVLALAVGCQAAIRAMRATASTHRYARSLRMTRSGSLQSCQACSRRVSAETWIVQPWRVSPQSLASRRPQSIPNPASLTSSSPRFRNQCQRR